MQAYNKAIEIDPNDAIIWHSKATVLYDQGRFKEAIQTLDKTIQLDPNDAEAWYNKGEALEELSLERLLVTLDPSDAENWNKTPEEVGDEARAAYAKAEKLGYTGPI